MTNYANSALRMLLLAGLVLSTSLGCQTGPRVETRVEEGPGSLLVVQTLKLQATVVAIDATTRTVKLKPRHGEEKTFRVGEGAVNFQQVRVGDEVHAVVIEQTAVTLVPGGALPGVSAREGVGVALAPVGSKPGGVMVETVTTTGTVVAIDGHEHTIALEFPDDRVEEFQVGKHRDLSSVGLGDSIRIQVTEAVAISVDKP